MMTKQGWIDWCRKQLADLSLRLFRQGYHPAKIAWLVEHDNEFRRRYHGFLEEMDVIMAEMIDNPAGFHHFDAFSRLKMDLLRYTNLERGRLLQSEMAA